jgi:hexosaminidase
MKRFLFVVLSGFLIFLSACDSDNKEKGTVSIIPEPVNTVVNPGFFHFTDKTRILVAGDNLQLMQTAGLLALQLKVITGFDFPVEKSETARQHSIFLILDNSLQQKIGNEGYTFSSEGNIITIKAATPAGIFYGIETLYQLLPVNLTAEDQKKGGWKVPNVEITDYPQFSWRGMHLDVSRHFFPVEFIKQYIDLIAMHKMNIFHWHLTDDNGWRIEIKKYPLLTDVSAWRVDRESLPWDERPLQQPGEKATYGGFYTQDQIREVIQYAADRYITVIPEIEMPGHSSEVFAAYPELSCRGEKLTVQPGSYWPNVDILCAGKDTTFVFIQNVLNEVAALFPAPYIHIGGDEANKTRWQACPLCQQRIKNEHLSGEDELQSYFIRRVEKMLTGMGKKMIGWDEILEGGLAPEATVMSWRGFEGGIEAAKQGHDVIMSPTSYCYFDYCQADPEYYPCETGGLITLKKVYSFQPIPSELTKEEAKHILGGQGNVWAEYIPTPARAEYQAVPRMTALAEVLWSPKQNHDWDDFRTRLIKQFERFDKMGVNYFPGSAKVEMTSQFNPEKKSFTVVLSTETPETQIYYTTDGSDPDQNSGLFKDSTLVDKTTTIKAIAYKDGKRMERPAEYDFTFHLGMGGKVVYNQPYRSNYRAQGDGTLVDGLHGSLAFNDGMWQGFDGVNLDVVIELQNESEINSITASFLQVQEDWIFFPVKAVYSVSEDGKTFQKLGEVMNTQPLKTDGPVKESFEYKLDKPVKAKYIHVEGVSLGVCPPWHGGSGQPCWVFADEIVIN